MTLVRKNHGTGHSYYADGVKLPGVTTILRMAAKPALVDWASRTTAEYALDHWAELDDLPPSGRFKALAKAARLDRDTAARRGTQVHRLAEQLSTAPPGVEVEVPDLLTGHVESYGKFLDAFAFEPIAVELVVVNREVGYCGTADAVGTMLGAVWLLELKTGRSGIFPESALQATGYARAETYTLAGEEGAEHPLDELGIERAAAVHIRGDGYDVRPLDTGDEVWQYFTRLAWMHHRREASEAWVGEAIEPLRAAS